MLQCYRNGRCTVPGKTRTEQPVFSACLRRLAGRCGGGHSPSTIWTGQLNAWPFAEINSEEFFDFTKARPEIVVEDGLLRQLRLPTIESFFWKRNTEGTTSS